MSILIFTNIIVIILQAVGSGVLYTVMHGCPDKHCLITVRIQSSGVLYTVMLLDNGTDSKWTWKD